MIAQLARRTVPVGMYLRRRPLRPELQPARLAEFLAALEERARLDGSVVEVGCFRGGTTVAANQHLRGLGFAPDYLAVDTFAGFVPEQFDEDERLGTPPSFRAGFAQNPKVIVERTMRHHRFRNVRIVQADICQYDGLPERISVCLMDVDLAAPIATGLERIVPRLVPGGVVLVDDCDEGTDWRGARAGYQRYCETHGLTAEYTPGGFGVIRPSVSPCSTA